MEQRANTMCAGMEERLAELLLAPESVSGPVREHVEGCEGCSGELASLRATLGAMDAWTAPEPNPYFLTRMEARIREVREEAPRSWLGRLRDRMLFGSTNPLRPVAALAMTVLLLVGGGAYLGLTNPWEQKPAAQDQTAAVVHDLQNLDSNAQLLDQLEQLSTNDQSDDSQQP